MGLQPVLLKCSQDLHTLLPSITIFSKVSVLLKWDVMNPVSDHLIEMQENNRVQEKLKNRNPFTDIPGLSLYLYGGINEATKEIYKTYASDFGLDPTMYDY